MPFCVRRLDDRREIVTQPVVGAGSQYQRLGVRVFLDGAHDRFLRDRAEDAVALVERRVEIDRMRAGQHHAVMHGLVAVAVEQQLLAGRDQRLEDHLVAGRGAVGGEEGAARAERLGRKLLRSAITPVGSISESSIGTDTDRSASNTCSPMNS